uniref:Cytochrome c biogenesis protein Ccs1 n=1 Tax=Cyanidium caldarium TaxID=2771 RepID=CCS1_CYACA|nr:c-type cytochrome biogenensis protein [Cyanidium caldarium]O19913.1 RecName: Full=Cytochrome c biogenesis protein Ccs1 [Cyanidium caldarium]AAB82676.1 unknown [Cyanidium caldarium]WDB00212.1 c-type cytochrome biogenensis protein [Cyanidium caldarium]
MVSITLKTNRIFRSCLNLATNLKFSITLFIIICIVSAIGTIIPQDKPKEFYMNTYSLKVLGMPLWKIIQLLSLEKIFYSNFYLILLLCLSFSLFFCSLKSQFPYLRTSRIIKLNNNNPPTSPLHESKKIKYNNIASKNDSSCVQLVSQGYKIYTFDKNLDKAGPLLIHLSLILILLGSAIHAFNDFIAQEMIPIYEVSHIQNVISSGRISKIPQTISLKASAFTVEHENEKVVKQFITNLAMLNSKGEVLKQGLVSVNHPLVYKQVYIFQMDWKLFGIRVNYGKNKIYEFPVQKIEANNEQQWSCTIPAKNQSKLILIFKNMSDEFYVYDNNQNFLKIGKINTPQLIRNTYFTVISKISGTGLQIKKDSSINIVYTGFLLLIIGLVINHKGSKKRT